MIQIYNKERGEYEQWGNKRSPITSATNSKAGIPGLENGYVICSKNYPIPPMKRNVSPYFGDTTRTDDIGRETKVYELKDFANSIILYKKNNTPENSTIASTIQNNKLASGVKEEANNKELRTSTNGYIINVWLENEYDSGSMTIEDFNVMTLRQNPLTQQDINFLSVDVPSAPINVTSKIAFNDLGHVSTGNTYIEIALKDPKQTSITAGDFNNINLIGINLQYSNLSNNDINTIDESSWTDISDIYWNNTTQLTSSLLLPSQLSSSVFANGIHNIDRVNDHNTEGAENTSIIRYYYVKINSTFLSTIQNYNVNSNFIFRARYKNASNNEFGAFEQSNIITINKPNKPTISSVKMTSYNKFTITLAKFGEEENIIGDATGITNNNMGVFLRNINFNVKYQYGNDVSSNIPNVGGWEIRGGVVGGGISSTTNTDVPVYINTNSFANSTYTYTLPAGLFPSSSTNTQSIRYYFSVRVQNNLIDDYSEISDHQLANSSIQITKPNSNIAITLTPQIGPNNNNKILATWSAPTDGNRGIVNIQADAGLPTLDRYTFYSSNLKNDSNNAVTYDTNINSSNRDSDPTINKTFNFYDSLKKGTTTTTNLDLDLTIREYNEYINDYTDVSITTSAIATKPSTITIGNETPDRKISKTTNKNSVTLNWSHPENRGLTINGSQITNTIIKYTIVIERSSTTNKYLDGVTHPIYTTYTQTENSSQAPRNGTTDALNYKTLNSDSSRPSLLWPNSTYEYTVEATNSLGYTSDMQNPKKSFTTGTPEIPDVFGYFTDTRLENLTSGITIDLNNNNSYANLGLPTTTITTSTKYSGTAVQITNYNLLSNITSKSFIHVLNKQNIQTFKTNSQVQTWSSSIPTEANQAGFKIVNAANGNALVYSRGMSMSHLYETDDDVLFQVLRTERKDIYAQTYDDRNRGYWFQENVQYKINLATNNFLTTYLYQPLKFVLQSHYNENGSDAAISANATGKVTILKNSNSSNGGNVYLDIINANPVLDSTSGITLVYTINNYINGVPNLAPIFGTYNKLKLSYRLNGYSSRFLLNENIDFTKYTFSNTNANGTLGNKKWNDFGNSAPSGVFIRNNTNWVITNHEFNITSTSSTSRTDIQVTINATNTYGTANIPINTGIHKFIYDGNSVTYYNTLGTSLKQAKQITTTDSTAPSTYTAVGNTTNADQLNMWNGWFYSKSGWLTTTSITNLNRTDYGLLSSDVMFSGGDNDYKFVIFEYSYTALAGYTPFGGFAIFGDNTDINLSDFAGGVYGGKEDVKIYLYIANYNMNSHYYLNVGKSTSTTFGNAAGARIVGYSGSGLGKVAYITSDNDNTWRSGGTMIATSGNGGWSETAAAGYTARPTNSNMKRTLNFIYNKIGNYNSNTDNTIFKHYLCIGIKNSINRKVKKPDLYIYGGDNLVKKLD
jgi:hypothetical protein